MKGRRTWSVLLFVVLMLVMVTGLMGVVMALWFAPVVPGRIFVALPHVLRSPGAARGAVAENPVMPSFDLS